MLLGPTAIWGDRRPESEVLLQLYSAPRAQGGGQQAHLVAWGLPEEPELLLEGASLLARNVTVQPVGQAAGAGAAAPALQVWGAVLVDGSGAGGAPALSVLGSAAASASLSEQPG